MNLSYMQVGWIAFALNMTSSIMQPVLVCIRIRSHHHFITARYVFKYAWDDRTCICTELYYCYYFCFIYRIRFRSLSSRRGSSCLYGGRGKTRISASDLSSGRKYREFPSSYFTALIFVPLGQIGSLGFTAFAAVGIVLLIFVSNWYRNELATGSVRRKRELHLRRKMRLSVHILNLLFYFSFFLLLYALGTVLVSGILSILLNRALRFIYKNAQYFVFAFMIAGVLGTFFGGPLAIDLERKQLLYFQC